MRRDDFLEHLDAFLDVYSERPLATNPGGMGMNHCFGLFAVLRHLRPSLVVESGVWKGQSTWIIEQAVPDAQIVCIDPSPDRRVYSSPSASYFTEDFAAIDWTSVDVDHSVCFFDDHQNAYARLMEMRWWGFRRAIFEDNFPVGQGDCYSLRHAFGEVGHPSIQMSPDYQLRGLRRVRRHLDEQVLRRFGMRQSMLREPNGTDAAALKTNIASYLEVPAIALNDENNWGGSWDGDYAPTTEPIFESVAADDRLYHLLAGMEPAARQRELSYGYMAYVELSRR